MKVLITAGGTREYIDGVRVLTNISSGALGASIASKFFKSDDIKKVTLLNTIQSVPIFSYNVEIDEVLNSHKFNQVYVKSVNDVLNEMEKLVPEHDVIIHLMAISDFTFDIKNVGKLKSDNTEAFIESMRDRIKIAPKILPMIKIWNPDCILISFKFENGGDEDALIKSAMKSMQSGNSDFVVANDKQLMKEAGTHTAFIIDNQGIVDNKQLSGIIAKPQSKSEIADTLLNIVKNFRK